jgi:hypothetical protein
MADKTIMATLNEETYDHKDLLVIKVPLSLPYQTDWKDFERVDGEIDIDGETYKYVKRKVVNGTLILLCLPDHHRTRLENAKETFFELVKNMQSQLPAKSTNQSGKVYFSNIFSDFDRLQPGWLIDACNSPGKAFISFFHANQIAPFIPKPAHPPELIQA